ncbi:unnamed protein product [Rangifer tarandus platyrhynchus]|uniref:Uncharacterized protein n=1 Tax=Rangifer tarandus platyrhynchus TaxID=3082113 RepID=A0AC59ZMN0_RANTA
MSLVPAAPVKPRFSRVHVQEAEGPGLWLKTLRMRCCQVHKKVDAGGDGGGAGSRVGEAVSGERPHEKAVPCAQEAGGATLPTSLSDPGRGLLVAQAQCGHRPVRHLDANFRNKALSPQGPGVCSGLAKWPGSLDGPVRMGSPGTAKQGAVLWPELQSPLAGAPAAFPELENRRPALRDPEGPGEATRPALGFEGLALPRGAAARRQLSAPESLSERLRDPPERRPAHRAAARGCRFAERLWPSPRLLSGSQSGGRSELGQQVALQASRYAPPRACGFPARAWPLPAAPALADRKAVPTSPAARVQAGVPTLTGEGEVAEAQGSSHFPGETGEVPEGAKPVSAAIAVLSLLVEKRARFGFSANVLCRLVLLTHVLAVFVSPVLTSPQGKAGVRARVRRGPAPGPWHACRWSQDGSPSVCRPASLSPSDRAGEKQPHAAAENGTSREEEFSRSAPGRLPEFPTSGDPLRSAGGGPPWLKSPLAVSSRRLVSEVATPAPQATCPQDSPTMLRCEPRPPASDGGAPPPRPPPRAEGGPSS